MNRRSLPNPHINSSLLRWTLAGILALSPMIGVTAKAETPKEKGLLIAKEADRRDLGFGDSTVELKMVLKNRHGQTSTRELRIDTLEIPDESVGDKSIVRFDHPRDIKGTALLTFTKILEPDDQWLYLPALRRVKRISSANKSGPFMGSELAYEDLTSQEVKKFKYRWLRDERCGKLQCFVVERYPQYENSGYTKQIVWTDQGEYRPMKIVFYDRKGALLKTLTFSNYRKYLGKYWRAHRLYVENHQTNKSTELIYEKYKLRTGLRESNFRPARLKRLR